MGGPVPKQLLELGGHSMLRRSLSSFDGHPDVSQIVIVLHESLVADGPAIVGRLERPHVVVCGGKRRQDSVRNGMAAVAPDVDLVLVHDAARPFAGRELIDRVIAATIETGAAVPAIPVRDTVKRVDVESRVVAATIPRDQVWLAQTPQGFRRAVLDDAITRGAWSDATDESMLAEQAGYSVRIVEGDIANMKVTTPEDLAVARSRFGAAGEARVGTGYDLHRLGVGRSLVLAGVVIPFEQGPVAHSDGDVLCHALIDAILGAAGAGDIGRHFPNTDAAWKDAPGLDLLARSVAIVRGLGWAVSNADATILLERPKLAAAMPEVVGRLAATLGIPADRIGVKAKTNEGVDAVGRGEAIAAHAVVMLVAAGSEQ
jgi:2-C-methyl-D-erythritol 4-phosphate cytidylyltransferase/2-C-methyl-D-erythritol 2,4-cyclodiphosphate synthase